MIPPPPPPPASSLRFGEKWLHSACPLHLQRFAYSVTASQEHHAAGRRNLFLFSLGLKIAESHIASCRGKILMLAENSSATVGERQKKLPVTGP